MIRAADREEPRHERIAVFGGVYNNALALERCIEDARARGAEALYCLGDLGGFGPHPERVFPLLVEHDVATVQGNYDHSIGNDRDDCACGYTDPRDNHFARISYRYTWERTPDRWKPWLRALPAELRLRLGPYRVLLCHGSPRRTNEFLWESATSEAFLRELASAHEADIMVGTHTGIAWTRALPRANAEPAWWVNSGVIGRPQNDGRTEVWYTMLDASGGQLRIEPVPLAYDHERLAREMELEGLPAEFVETVRTGWWTTCMEILPMKERRAGRF